MYKAVFTIVSFILSLSCVHAQGDSSYDDFLNKAVEQELFNDPEWLLLNHFWRDSFGFLVSRIDEPEFFFSQSFRDPESELKAFLKAVIGETPNLQDKSIQCRYPARFNWLNKKLGLTEKKIINKEDCPEFEAWRQALDVEKVYLVFPAAYLNNPASMFGHTLLRLDSKEGVKNPLLSYAASFTAGTGDDGGIAFAAKGLLGGYRASYNVEPYYETVERYGDIEHRDIWEFELLLNSDERNRMVMSLWELGHTYFNYYFFDENCSFYLLALLDTVRPELNLMKDFNGWVIPSDTLKVILNKSGLVGEMNYRPSLTQKLEIESTALSREEISMGKEIAAGGLTPHLNPDISTNQQSKILEFSFDYLEFLNSKKNENFNSDRALAQSILMERSKLPEVGKPPVVENLTDRPDNSHKPGRALALVGNKAGRQFYDFEIKPAYHDLLDSPEGFKDGAAIDFFNFRVRQYETENLQIQNFTVFNVESLSPWTRVFKPLSWGVKVGLDRETIANRSSNDLDGSQIGSLGGFYGLTVNPIDSLMMSFLPSARFNYSRAYQNDNYALGLGGLFKLTFKINEDIRMIGSYERLRFGSGEEHFYNSFRSEMNYDLSKDIVLRLGTQRQGSFNTYFSEIFSGIGFYF